MARLCRVTSACFGENIRWLFLTQPACKHSRDPAPASAVYPLYTAALSQNNKTAFLCSPIILIIINSNCSLSASQKVHTNYSRFRVMR